jgi:hypothetical protein
MRPAASRGKKVLPSSRASTQPRLPALIALAPEPRHGRSHPEKNCFGHWALVLIWALSFEICIFISFIAGDE